MFKFLGTGKLGFLGPDACLLACFLVVMIDGSRSTYIYMYVGCGIRSFGFGRFANFGKEKKYLGCIHCCRGFYWGFYLGYSEGEVMGRG